MPQSYLEAVRQDDQTVNPLFSLLKARLTRAENGRAEIVMPVSAALRQGAGMVAGGILATLADEAMAHAVLSGLASGRSAVTAEMNIRYLRAPEPSERETLTARATIVKNGQALCVTEAGVYDGRERLLATAGATFYLLPAPEGR